MTWWAELWAQFWGQLLAGLALIPIVLGGEAMLDEWRDRRHERHRRR